MRFESVVLVREPSEDASGDHAESSGDASLTSPERSLPNTLSCNNGFLGLSDPPCVEPQVEDTARKRSPAGVGGITAESEGSLQHFKFLLIQWPSNSSFVLSPLPFR